MVELPRSLTAIVHLRFNYDEKQRRLVGEAEVQLLDDLMGKAAGLDPELQELLLKFAAHVQKTSPAPKDG